jgi:hypothetical protein
MKDVKLDRLMDMYMPYRSTKAFERLYARRPTLAEVVGVLIECHVERIAAKKAPR